MTRALGPNEKLCPNGHVNHKWAEKCLDCSSGVTVLYRYEDRMSDAAPRTYLREYRVDRETRATWFILNGYKRVLKAARKSFAYPTIELARESYVIRKRKQLGYIKSQHDHVSAIVARIDAGTVWDELSDDSIGFLADFEI